MKPDRLLLTVIKEQLTGERTEQTRALITEEMLPTLCELAKHHDLAHLFAAYLDSLGMIGDDEMSEKLRKIQMTQVFRHHRIVAEQKRVCALLKSENIPFIPLKGAVIREMYPESWYRPSCDVDILVREEDVQRAKSLIMQRLDYTCADIDNFHDVPMYSKGGVHLELHFNILEHKGNIDAMLGRVWEFASPVSEGDAMHALTPEFLLFHNVAHSYYHFLSGGCGIKPFMDLFVLLSHPDFAYDEDKARRLMRECGIERFYDASLRLTEVWFEGAESDSLTDSFGTFVLKGGVYGTQKNRVTVKRKEKGGKLSYILSRIFMPYESLKYRYPVLKKHKILTPFCQVARWFSVLSPKRRRSVKNELTNNASITDNEIDQVKALLDGLGIES